MNTFIITALIVVGVVILAAALFVGYIVHEVDKDFRKNGYCDD